MPTEKQPLLGSDGELVIDAHVPRRPSKVARWLLRSIGAFSILALVAVLSEYIPSSRFPFLGPYYANLTFMDERPFTLPCEALQVVTRVENKPSVTARLWSFPGDIDMSQTPNADGDIIFLLSGDDVSLIAETSYLTEPFFIRLYDAENNPLSGMEVIRFIDTCSVFVGFAQYTHIPDFWGLRPPSPHAEFHLSISDPTSSDVYGCEWSGVMGTTHDDFGPIKGTIAYELYLVGGDQPKLVGRARSDDNPEVGGGGWSIQAEAGQTYILEARFAAENANIMGTAFEIPAGNCQQRIIQAAVVRIPFTMFERK